MHGTTVKVIGTNVLFVMNLAGISEYNAVAARLTVHVLCT